MSFWKIATAGLVFFIVFLYFSERMMQSTIDKALALEAFADKRKKNKRKRLEKCSDYFVPIPQDLNIYENCVVVSPDKRETACETVSKKEFCGKLRKSGWDPSWTKKMVKQKKNGAEIKKVRKRIEQNLGFVTEIQIETCFPNYAKK